MKATKTKQNTKSLMWNIMTDIKWASISRNDFGKSRSWLSQKMNGFDGNGSETEFTETEKQTLKTALQNLAERINNCADKL